MASIHPHIHYNGNAEAAFTFYKSVFGGSFSKLMRFKELSTEGFQFPEKELEKIMHIALPIGGGTVLIPKYTNPYIPQLLRAGDRITIGPSSKSAVTKWAVAPMIFTPRSCAW
mgnify:CR=1 FL=1